MPWALGRWPAHRSGTVPHSSFAAANDEWAGKASRRDRRKAGGWPGSRQASSTTMIGCPMSPVLGHGKRPSRPAFRGQASRRDRRKLAQEQPRPAEVYSWDCPHPKIEKRQARPPGSRRPRLLRITEVATSVTPRPQPRLPQITEAETSVIPRPLSEPADDHPSERTSSRAKPTGPSRKSSSTPCGKRKKTFLI